MSHKSMKRLSTAWIVLFLTVEAFGQVWINTNVASTVGPLPGASPVALQPNKSILYHPSTIRFMTNLYLHDDWTNTLAARINAKATTDQIPTNAVCVGGWLNPDAFTLAPVAFTVLTNVTAEAFETNLEYVARLLTLDGAPAWNMNPTVLRQSDTNATPIAWAVTSAANVATFSNSAVYFNGATGATVSGTLGAWVVLTNLKASISPPVVQTQAVSAVAGTARALVDGIIRPGIVAGKTNVVMTSWNGNTNMVPVLADLAWNTNSWIYDYRPTCVSWSNSAYAESLRCTLISSNLAIGAKHWSTREGDILLFLDATNGHHRTTVAGKNTVTGDVNDIVLLALNPPLPSVIVPAKFLPDNYATYLANEFQLPVLFFDKFYRANAGFLSAGELEQPKLLSVYKPTFSPWDAYYNTPISGDSGNPALVAFATNEYAVLTSLESSGTGPSYIAYKARILAAVSAWYGANAPAIGEIDFGALGAAVLGE